MSKSRRHSAGLLMYRGERSRREVFLVHPGGPFWARKDHGAWSIPKGEIQQDESPLAAARREFFEETGIESRCECFHDLGVARQSGGKLVYAWAFEGDCDPATVRSNSFSLEWPPHSGKQRQFPEVDRAAWFPLDEARSRILAGQRVFLDAVALL